MIVLQEDLTDTLSRVSCSRNRPVETAIAKFWLTLSQGVRRSPQRQDICLLTGSCDLLRIVLLSCVNSERLSLTSGMAAQYHYRANPTSVWEVSTRRSPGLHMQWGCRADRYFAAAAFESFGPKGPNLDERLQRKRKGRGARPLPATHPPLCWPNAPSRIFPTESQVTAVLHSRTPILAGLGFLTLIIALAPPVLAQAPS